MELKRYTT